VGTRLSCLPPRRSGGASGRGGLDDEIDGAALDYEAISSQAGIQRIKAGAVDFAVSEMPLPADDLRRHGLVQVPLVAGAVAVAVNIEGLATAEWRLTPSLLADIFLGRVKTWADPAIGQLNPGMTLPAAPIAVVHRTDGSGTTYTFTTFLAQSDADWRSQIGSDLLVNWPVGEGAKCNAGVAQALQRTPHSIAYLDLVQARTAKLQTASVRYISGRFVAPNGSSVQAAMAAAS
jgi:phosphate transport system substrate-binding protein